MSPIKLKPHVSSHNMQKEKPRNPLKRWWLIIVFFLSFSQLYSQSIILKGTVFNENNNPIWGAMVYNNGKLTKISSNKSGVFELMVSSYDTINVIYKGSNDYFIIPSEQTNRIEKVFLLSLKTSLFEEVSVSSNRLKKVAGEYNEHIVDYHVFENGDLALLKKYKHDYYLSFQRRYGVINDYILPFSPVEFHLDCAENLRIIGKDSTLHFSIDSTLHLIERLSNIYVQKNLKPIIYCGDKGIIYWELSHYNRKYTLIHKTENSYKVLNEFLDTTELYAIWEKYDFIAFDNYITNQGINREVPLLYQHLRNSQNSKPICSVNDKFTPNNTLIVDQQILEYQVLNPINIQSFSIDRRIITLDFLNKNIIVLNHTGKIVHMRNFNMTNQTFTKVIKDPYTNQFYLRSEDEPITEIAHLNIFNGEATYSLTLKEVRFPQKVKVFNNQLYFISINDAGFGKLHGISLKNYSAISTTP
jgi:hypothetical protein